MRIFVMGMADSVHLSRWLSQFSDQGHEIRVFSSSPHRRIHPQLKIFLENTHSTKYSISYISKYFSLPMWLMDRFFGDRLRGTLARYEIKKFGPDFIHVLEFQNAGYVLLRALHGQSSLTKLPILLTPYGSDIFWFQKFPNHLKKIKQLLSFADAISSECHRDEMLATEYGFSGLFMPRVPAFGSIELPNSPVVEPKRVIAVKGYQNKWGQALLALKSLESIPDQLRNVEIVIYSCDPATMRAIRGFRKRTGLTVSAYPKGALTNAQVLDIFSDALIYVGLSTSDGISASMIEAMSRGAVPIQSNTSCCSEWMDDGVGGFLVDYWDVEKVASIILRILSDEDFRNSAASHNLESLKSKAGQNQTIERALLTYERMGQLARSK